jgi:CheY-like chemotaxis protein/nitrogen-specific signal transduction histidine kinase
LFSVLLFTLLRLQSRARHAAEETAATLRRSEAELQKAARAKDEFLATLSHELRTPMTAILGWSKLLQDELDDETRRAAIDAIQKSGKAQAQLIDDLLDVSRITSGKMRIEPKPVDLVPIARAALDAVAPAAEGKGVIIAFDAPGEGIAVRGDANRLQQVIWNLLSNAVKFTARGGRVDLRVAASGTEAVLTVSDSGQGIDPAFLPYVFERFRQADSSTTRAYTGLGLGLAIVRHLVELHGGNVTAHSEGIGQGAHFTARIPLLDAAGQKQVGEPRDEHVVAASLREAKVLVIDDEEDVRNYAGAVFRMSGAEVRCVPSAADAIDALQKWRPDVIVSDIGMPERDGYDLLREIRAMEATASIPVIALTAYARPEDREAAERAGFDAFVPKPADPARLRGAVAEVLSGVSQAKA